MSQSSSIRSLWHRWKSLKLPWRKSRLIGEDLSGTTFWELRNDNLPSRPRRMAVYPRKTHHSDVNLDPAWIQWLRHTRASAPSIQEQLLEIQRQAQLKQLAVAADKRWAEKPSYLDKPEDTAQLPPEVLKPSHKAAYEHEAEVDAGTDEEAGSAWKAPADAKTEGDNSERDLHKKPSRERSAGRVEDKDNPWAKHRGGPSEEWQPESWIPGRVERR